jgi:hypothetical protein
MTSSLAVQAAAKKTALQVRLGPLWRKASLATIALKAAQNLAEVAPMAALLKPVEAIWEVAVGLRPAACATPPFS